MSELGDPSAEVERVELSAEVMRLTSDTTAGIVVLPSTVTDGRGIYSESSVMLVKELRALGADATFAQPSDQRLFEVKKSAEALLIAVVIGMASNASWDLLKHLLRRSKEARLSVTYVELEDGNGQRGSAWQVRGDADGVIRAIDRLRHQAGDSPEIGDGSTGQGGDRASASELPVRWA